MTSPWPVQVVALNAVSCGSVLWQAGSAERVTVIVKATLALAHERLAWPIAPLPIVREDRHGPSGSLEAASEVAPYLPSVGVVLTGHACAPGGHPVATMIARLAIYRGETRLLDKRLTIVGDRSPVPPWRSQPFQRMPLVYERAFGGPGVPDNPVGVGASSSAAPALPNLLDPFQPTRAAGMGPISPRWPARQRLLGAAEARGGGPPQAGLPAGFDWRYFHAAPPDQQLPFLHGDEWLVLDGLHPGLPRVQTQLPSARALARRYPAGAGGQGQPVELAADTLVIDADRQICSVVWRGSFALDRAEDRASIRVCAGLELPGHPLSWPSLEQAAPPQHTRPSAPGGLGTTLPVSGTSRASAPVLPFSPSSAAAPAQASPAASAARDAPPSPWSGVIADEETRMPDPEELALQLQAPLAPFALAPPGSPAQPAAPIPGAPWAPPEPAPPPRPAAPPSAIDDGETARADLELPKGQERASEAEDAPVPPRSSAAGAGAAAVDSADERLRAEVIARLRAGEPLGGLELAHADLSGLDLSRASLSALDLQGARLRGCKLAGARLTDAKLAGADLGGADLSGADLTRADLSRAVLEGARLDGATLHEAILASARGAGASLAAVTGARASFARGLWDSASFEGADLLAPNLAGASLGGARFTGASLLEARLDDARGAGAVFDRATLGNARAPGAELTGCSFQDAAAPGSAWQGAKLDGSRFAGADLTGADLSRTSCASSVFAGAGLAGANMQRAHWNGADLEGARLTGADLRQARLEEARLDGASLGRVIAHRADLGGCRLVRADLSGANLRASRLRGADLSFARLDGADLRDAELDGANVYGASRQGAKLSKRDEARLVEVPPPPGDPGGGAAGS
ncbi:DUF2169 domain-containing protein [Sorangium sp. So ce134]